jgi:thioredoxin-like negative regulator of GroEL
MTRHDSPRVRRAADASESGGSRRRLRRWAAAAPSLLAIVACLLVAAAALSQRADQTNLRYRQTADAALAAEDFRTARVCYERLLQSSPNDDALRFGLARSLKGLGQAAESSQILQRLAPLRGPVGYAPAHLLLAREQLLFGPHDAPSLAAAEAHLRRVLDADPTNADARSLLASLYANTGRSAPAP